MIARAFIKQQESLTPLPPPGPRRMRLKKRGRRKSHVTESLSFSPESFSAPLVFAEKEFPAYISPLYGYETLEIHFPCRVQGRLFRRKQPHMASSRCAGQRDLPLPQMHIAAFVQRDAVNILLLSGSHRWDKLGVRGNEHYTCRKCRMSLRTDGRPAGYGCSNNSMHLWHKL